MTRSSTPSLRESAKQALLWSAGLMLARDVLQFAQMLVLARLLEPAMYGAAALASTVVGFLGMASFQHVIPHVLQVRDGESVNWDEHFTAGLCVNGLVFVLTNAVALGVGATARYAALQPLLHVSSLTFLLTVPADLRVKMLERELAWGRLRNLQFAALVAAIATGIGLALVHAGAYALVVPGVVSVAVIAGDLLLVHRWKPRLQWNRTSYAEPMKFGLNRATSNALNAGRGLIQNGLIAHQGQFFGLGIFSRADALANLFCARVSQQVTGALYPVVTRATAGSGQFRRMTALALRAVGWTVLPIATFASLAATDIVHVLYGHRWDAAIPLVPWTMAAGAATSIGATCYSFLLANDQARNCLRLDAIAFVLLAALMAILIPFGVETYLPGLFAGTLIIGAMLMTALVRTGGTQGSAAFDCFAPPIAACAIGAAIAIAARPHLDGTATALALATEWVLFTSAYLITLRVAFPRLLSELVDCLPGTRLLTRMLLLQPVR